MGKLTAIGIRALTQPGRYGDGDGLYLLVANGGTKSWIVRVQKNRRRRDVGLGSYKKRSLAEARADARIVRQQSAAGKDPVLERKRAAGIPTFEDAAKVVHAEHKKAWRSRQHQQRWLRALEMYAFPAIGKMRVADIEMGHLRDMLSPIWSEKPETARRLLQRTRAVLDWAYASQYRDTEIPTKAVLRGLPRQSHSVQHFKALPYIEVAGFIALLQARSTVSRLALEALILTAVRSGSIRHCTWDALDFERNLWTIPKAKMKGGEEFVVPLSPQAVAVFKRAAAYRTSGNELVFPGQKRGKPLSDVTLLKLMNTLGIDATAHGFRSTFRDWVAECTNFPAEVAELALSHTIRNKIEAAYRRGNLLAKRRALMDAWARYCSGAATGEVIQFAAR